MLLSQHCGWHQNRNLFAVCHGFKSGTQGNLGLAVADVTAKQPVHRAAGFHVGFDLLDCQKLVGRLDVGEGCFQFFLPVIIRIKGVAFRGLTLSVEFQEVLRHFHDGVADPAFG